MLVTPCAANLKPVIPPSAHRPKEVIPFKDPLIFSSQPKERDLIPVHTSGFAHVSSLSFCDVPENSLTPDQLLSFDAPPVDADKTNYCHLETPRLEYPVRPQLQFEILDGLKRNDPSPASEAAQPHFPVLRQQKRLPKI